MRPASFPFVGHHFRGISSLHQSASSSPFWEIVHAACCDQSHRSRIQPRNAPPSGARLEERQGFAAEVSTSHPTTPASLESSTTAAGRKDQLEITHLQTTYPAIGELLHISTDRSIRASSLGSVDLPYWQWDHVPGSPKFLSHPRLRQHVDFPDSKNFNGEAKSQSLGPDLALKVIFSTTFADVSHVGTEFMMFGAVVSSSHEKLSETIRCVTRC